MRLMRFFLAIAAVTMLMSSATNAGAHEHFRIVGTIAEKNPATIFVNAVEGSTLVLEIGNQTAVWRDRTKLDLSALTVGSSVDIDALGDSLAELTAMRVLITGSAATPK